MMTQQCLDDRLSSGASNGFFEENSDACCEEITRERLDTWDEYTDLQDSHNHLAPTLGYQMYEADTSPPTTARSAKEDSMSVGSYQRHQRQSSTTSNVSTECSSVESDNPQRREYSCLGDPTAPTGHATQAMRSSVPQVGTMSFGNMCQPSFGTSMPAPQNNSAMYCVQLVPFAMGVNTPQVWGSPSMAPIPSNFNGPSMAPVHAPLSPNFNGATCDYMALALQYKMASAQLKEAARQTLMNEVPAKTTDHRFRQSDNNPGAELHINAETPVSRNIAIAAHVEVSDDVPGDGRTTIMLKNLPNDYTRDMFLKLLDSEGFSGSYDFLYLPVDFRRWAGFGYAFVNAVTHADAKRMKQHFEGFQTWKLGSAKVCEVRWGEPLQGLDMHIERYRNCPVMHELVQDEFKPVVFHRGQRVAFPAPTKRIRPPMNKKYLPSKTVKALATATN